MTSNDPNNKELDSETGEQKVLNERELLMGEHEAISHEQKAKDIHGHADTAAPYEGASGFPVRFAGFWMRFWAYLLDLIVVGSIDRLLINPIFRALDIPLGEVSILAPVSIATAITFYAYFVLMTKFFGQTLGKMVFGLKVIGLDGGRLSWSTILFREWIGRFISATVIVGYIIVAFLPKKQGLHDLFADTTVIHENR